MLVSSLGGENYHLLGVLTSSCFTISDSGEEAKIFVKDRESIPIVDVEQFEVVIIVDFPPTIGEYTEILTRTACHSVIGILHSFFSKADASVAKPLITLLEQCRQIVPEALRSLDPFMKLVLDRYNKSKEEHQLVMNANSEVQEELPDLIIDLSELLKWNNEA